ncbi:MAG TPA: GatB/YqeY domain-containing protein, partial [Caldimonas sp.]|nr:GatB/YqeY domain-containing protein [Caldimonas sp.]
TQFAAGARQDLVDKETAELQILETYLPQRLSADAVGIEVAAVVAEIGASGPADMGRTMAAAKARLGGRADMATVSAAVKAALSR